MRKLLPRSIRVLLLALLLISTGAAATAEQNDGKPLSLSEAAARVQAESGGRVLAARIVQRDQRAHYEIQVLLKPGHVRVYRIDPDSGRSF